MRVAFFIGSLNRGGTEMLILDVFKRREIAPFDMVLIYRNDGDLSEAYKETGVPMFRLKPNDSKLKYIRDIRNLLKKEKIDILHAQTLTNALAGVMCTSFSRVKLVFTFHGLFSVSRFQWIWSYIMWKSDAVIFVSEFLQNWYLHHSVLCPRGRCNMVYNGVDFKKIDGPFPVPDFLKQFESEQTVRLCMVGNFVSGRSQMVVCKGLKLLKDRGTDFQFFFIGGGKEQESWLFEQCVNYCEQNGLSSQVHFVGSRGDVPAILQHIDGFVFSTVRDTFGIAVIEAVSAGVPTITNDWAVMKEISCDGTFFELFKSGDEYDCCMKMQQLIDTLPERKIQAKQNADVIKRIYSIDNHIVSLGAVYNKVSKN